MSRVSLLTGNNIVYKKNIRKFIDYFTKIDEPPPWIKKNLRLRGRINLLLHTRVPGIFVSSTKRHFINKILPFDEKMLQREEDGHKVDKTTGNLGYGWIHYGLIRNLKPQRILVIGSRYGYIPAICALACKDSKKGGVDFVDAGFHQGNTRDKHRHWGGVGFWKESNVKRHFGKFGLNDYLKGYIMTSVEFYQRHPKRTWGYIYLDGDHSYAGIKSDFNRFWPRLMPGGFIVFHDLNIKKQGGFTYGIWKLWEELENKGHKTIELPGKYGLGLIQK